MPEFMEKPVPIHSVNEIDLSRHAVIEASAGTGKTYTIEALVVDLLAREAVAGLDEILVVTFTEKATGELKDRIRKRIEQRLVDSPIESLQNAYDNFDTASIYTIHGFCYTILREFAFEHGEHLQSEITDDRTAYRHILHHLLRDEWPSRYGDTLGPILRLSGFPSLSPSGDSAWIDGIIEIALRYQPSAGDRIIPGPGVDILHVMKKAEDRCRDVLDELSGLVGAIDQGNIEQSDLCVRYQSLNINRKSIAKRVRILSGVLALCAAHRDHHATLVECAAMLSEIEIGEAGFRELDTGWRKDGADHHDKLPHLSRIIELLEALREIDLDRMRQLFPASAIAELKDRAAAYKRSQGWISYDDMVGRVHEALARPGGMLQRLLQRRYRYALVDEFQDTDMVQWAIFKSIFLEGDAHRLVIIGDPKQSIYGFRGADINAYFTAREEMIRIHGARYYSLVDNWRSSPRLIDAFNALFAGEAWFTGSAIECPRSSYPEHPGRRAFPETDTLVIINCGDCNATTAKRRNARFIAEEIASLCRLDPSLMLDHIAILFKKWSEAVIVEKALHAAGINYSYYKKDGLYQSREALELLYLLKAITRPSDVRALRKALATRFFRIPLNELRRAEGLTGDHSAVRLLKTWRDLAGKRDWPKLFDSILSDTGVLFISDISNHERAMINYRSIIQNLEGEAYRGNLTLVELTDYLARLRNRVSYPEEGYNLHRIDNETPGVRLMTIHACKGLEFRMVFIAGGFTGVDRTDFWTYHLDGRRVFDLVMDSDQSAHYIREQSGETERLFYVALTRACERLYVPVYRPSSGSRKPGMLGEKFPVSMQRLEKTEGVKIREWDEQSGTSGTIHPATAVNNSLVLPEPLLPNENLRFLERTTVIESFSRLKHKLSRAVQRTHAGIDYDTSITRDREEDDEPPLISPEVPATVPYAGLPPGRDTGHLVHEVMERIDFCTVAGASGPDALRSPSGRTAGLIDMAISRHFKSATVDERQTIAVETARIAWNTLRIPLDGNDLILCKIARRTHEVEFYFPARTVPPGYVPGITVSDGFVHGIIDLVFEYQGRYYILDWKTNILPEGYTREQMGRNINEMGYDIQMKIYTAALLQYLRIRIPGKDPRTLFGGIFYLYLRGIDGLPSRNGIYFLGPDDIFFTM